MGGDVTAGAVSFLACARVVTAAVVTGAFHGTSIGIALGPVAHWLDTLSLSLAWNQESCSIGVSTRKRDVPFSCGILIVLSLSCLRFQTPSALREGSHWLLLSLRSIALH